MKFPYDNEQPWRPQIRIELTSQNRLLQKLLLMQLLDGFEDKVIPVLKPVYLADDYNIDTTKIRNSFWNNQISNIVRT